MKKLMLLSLLLIVSSTQANMYIQSNEVKTFKESGRASYYSDHLTGRKTASGELYHPDSLTAAHKTLPFGTIVKVTCIKNQRSVIVIINDRGPYRSKRIIDLSKAAYQKIDSTSSGHIEVELELIEPE